MSKSSSSSLSLLLLLMFVLLTVTPTLVSSECTCEPESNDDDRNQQQNEALKYKLVGVVSILIAGAIGVSLPILGRFIPAFHPDNDIFFIIKAFAAGVILATGFVHVLPDAFESLTSPCLTSTTGDNPWGKFPFSGFIAMLSAIGALMIDVFVTSYFNNKAQHQHHQPPNNYNPNDEEKGVDNKQQLQYKSGGGQGLHVHTHSTHGHSHGSAPTSSSTHMESNTLDLIRRRVISQVLELGIVVHSVIIGVSLGASESPKTIKPLVAALTFHQMFEGMGLGGCISQANFNPTKIAVMSIFFSLTTPIGIAIGYGISNIYDENSPTALIVEGVFNSASAGILIYMALVDLLAADLIMSPRMQTKLKLQIASNLSLLLGAGCMSLLANWA